MSVRLVESRQQHALAMFCAGLVVLAMMFAGQARGGEKPAAEKKSADLVISPVNLSPGDKLTLKMPLPHPGNLAIRSPEGRMYYLHDPASKVFMELAQDFSEVNEVKLEVSRLTAAYWSDGEKKHGLVFKTPGKYMVYIADDLELEPEEISGLVATVYYKAP